MPEDGEDDRAHAHAEDADPGGQRRDSEWRPASVFRTRALGRPIVTIPLEEVFLVQAAARLSVATSAAPLRDLFPRRLRGEADPLLCSGAPHASVPAQRVHIRAAKRHRHVAQRFAVLFRRRNGRANDEGVSVPAHAAPRESWHRWVTVSIGALTGSFRRLRRGA